VARFTEQMFNKWGYGVYFFFASLMIISAFFVFFAVPETKAVPLEVMDRLFEARPVWRANEKILAELAQEDQLFRENLAGAGEKRVEVEEAEDAGEVRGP
jgi:hypothetical protein